VKSWPLTTWAIVRPQRISLSTHSKTHNGT
jgi:hypothetical protein